MSKMPRVTVADISLTRLQYDILTTMKEFLEPLTDREIFIRLPVGHDSNLKTVSSRRIELVNMGFIQQANVTKEGTNGRPVTCWQLTDKAYSIPT